MLFQDQRILQRLIFDRQKHLTRFGFTSDKVKVILILQSQLTLYDDDDVLTGLPF